jgi:tetratricopeptide (TPR) repeat protein
MKRTDIAIAACLLILTVATACSQTQVTRQRLIAAKQLLRQGDNTSQEECFHGAKALLANCTTDGEWQALAEYYLGYADYRLGVVVHRMDKERSIVYLDSAVQHLETAIEKQNDFADAHALVSSCYGMKISFAPLKGIVLGPKSRMEMERARRLSPDNPRVALLEAISTYNTPGLFGGGKERGLEAMKRASELFDRWNAPDSLLPDWGKAEVYAWIGLAYLDRKESILARKAFESALRINPDYGWVKYALLPKVTSHSSVK